MEHVVVIKPGSRWKLIDLPELIRYKDLLYFLTIRGLKSKYAQSVLGVGWAVIQPLLLTLVFTIVFGRLAGISSDGAPYLLFSLCGMIPWTYFSGTITEASGTMIGNSNMISKVYFPRMILPLSAVLSKLLDMFIAMIVLVIALIIYGILPGVEILLLPVLVLLLILFSFSLGLLLCAMSVKYRDVKHIMPFFLQLLLYVSPIVYPTSAVPTTFRWLYSLNPLTGIIEGFRSCILGTTPIPWMFIATSAIATAVLLFMSLFYFNKLERSFADIA